MIHPTERRALLLFMEPTPYILGLIEEIRRQTDQTIDVAFIGHNLSQRWDIVATTEHTFSLPPGRVAALTWVMRRLASREYSILHLSGWGHPVLLGALLTGAILRLRIYVESDTPLTESTSWVKHSLKRMFYPFLFRLPTRVLPGGSRQAGYFRHYGVEASRIRVVGMTADVVAYSRNAARLRMAGAATAMRMRLGVLPSATVFIFIGRLEAYKGIDTMIEAMNLIRGRQESAVLLIVGDGSLQGRVEEASVENPAIRNLGRLGGDGLVTAMVAADVAVLDSRRDAWGLVVNEAMACGLPLIVSSRVGCVDDLVKDGVTGLVIEPEHADVLADAMCELIRYPERRKLMGSNAYEHIGNWTMENWAGNIVSAWREKGRA